MPWGVTPSDVLNITGASATVAQIAQADAVISIYVNRDSAASASMGARDLGWIRMAVQWQTPWQASQAGFTQRNQYDSLSQDGLSVQSSAEWAKVLAPLAARALKNLTWKGSKTSRQEPVELPVGVPGADFTLESTDWYSHWEA